MSYIIHLSCTGQSEMQKHAEAHMRTLYSQGIAHQGKGYQGELRDTVNIVELYARKHKLHYTTCTHFIIIPRRYRLVLFCCWVTTTEQMLSINYRLEHNLLFMVTLTEAFALCLQNKETNSHHTPL